ncbi:MAG: bifunctional pyr operon transcriptional regulator/uracil phosphoribosyltransferase PyrR [Candidatus Meridianibacter frigidus]|nr:MAG: bifunctional pyr operon transcriptional regulator/uracil phosphoribosyltransferase PyrR [Candidatus Eremiobacteraeota bacterium]
MSRLAEVRTLLGAPEIERIIARLAHQIMEPDDAQDGLFIIGLRRGGVALAQRIASKIEGIAGRHPAIGFLNINLYRDDEISRELPDSSIPAEVDEKTVVIVDDVLFTGRTVRAALDAVIDLGRPSRIRLCVLIDRGLRELPVQADYVGRFIPSGRSERIVVKLGMEESAEDRVSIHAGPP